jgi:hypothetical protein
MSQHTPGPWKAFGRGIFMGDLLVGTTTHTSDVEKSPYGKFPESEACEANARLIAAAPDLLEAAQSVLDYADMDEFLSDAHNNAVFGIRAEDLRELRAAMSRATGDAS